MTLEQWVNLEEDHCDEFVDGRLEGEAPDYLHETVVAFLVYVLTGWGKPRGALVAASGAKFIVGPQRGRMPDVTVFFAGSPRPPRTGPIRVPPSIAIEVVSPTPRDERRDRIEKAREYAAFGVRWYWLVDPALKSFEVWELGSDGRYAQALAVDDGVIDPVPGCEGLRIDLASLWSDIEALPEAKVDDEGGRNDGPRGP